MLFTSEPCLQHPWLLLIIHESLVRLIHNHKHTDISKIFNRILPLVVSARKETLGYPPSNPQSPRFLVPTSAPPNSRSAGGLHTLRAQNQASQSPDHCCLSEAELLFPTKTMLRQPRGGYPKGTQGYSNGFCCFCFVFKIRAHIVQAVLSLIM